MMANAVDLISHGAGEGIYYCLNAMASLFHGGKHSFIGSIMVISSMFAAGIATYKMVLEQNLQIPANWLLFNSIVMVALTIPTVNVMIIDRVTGFRAPVSNVPWLFAVPAGFISQIGDVVALKIDASLAMPHNVATPKSFKDAITANRNGVVMNAKLIANAAHFDFVSEDMANNMREFVKECVYYDLAFGKYTIDELKSTDNLWRLVSERVSPLGGVIYQSTNNKAVQREFLTCQETVQRISNAWPEELRKAYEFYGKKLFPFGAKFVGQNSNSLLKANLVHAYDYLTGISKSADSIMQQNIMRNAIQDGFMTRAQEDGAAASIQSYAVARAESFQASVYATQGGIAEKAVSYMKIVIEIIFYGMFPFVAIMLVLPSGVNMLKTYFTGLIWLQSWAPLYSLINMIVHIYCRGDTFTAASTLTTPALTYDTIPALGEAGASVARYAGYAMMSVPFLSWGLFKYGGGALAQMSSYLGSPTQSASNMAAQEISSGNVSFGIRNFDSTSRSMVNSFKQDDNASISSGSTSFQTANGASIRITPNGEGIIDRVSSMSKLGIGITDKNEIASSMNEMSSKSLSNAQTSLTGYTNSMSTAYDQMMDFRVSRANSLSNDASIGVDHATSASRAFQKVDDVVDSYSKIMGHDKRKAVESLNAISAGMAFSGGISAQIPFFGKLLNGGATINAGLDHKHQWSDTDVDNLNTVSQEQLQLSQKYTEAMDEVNRVFQNDSVRNSSTEAANFSDGFSARLTEADSYRKDVQNSLTESEAWQKSASLVSTSSVGVTDDLSQEFVDYASYQLGPDGYELGVQGVQNAMDDPILRKQLLNGFIEFHRDKVLKTYSGVALNNSSSIQNNFDKNQNDLHDSLQNQYKNISQTVITAAANKNLDVPVDTKVMNTALTQMTGNSNNLSDNQHVLHAKEGMLLDSKNNFDAKHPLAEE